MKYVLILIIISIISCSDRGFSGVNSEYSISNTSGIDLNFKMYSDTGIMEAFIEVNNDFSLGVFNSESSKPYFFNSDSIVIEFLDNKKINYKSRDCYSKSILCVTNFECRIGKDENNEICKFVIDNIEYQRAK